MGRINRFFPAGTAMVAQTPSDGQPSSMQVISATMVEMVNSAQTAGSQWITKGESSPRIAAQDLRERKVKNENQYTRQGRGQFSRNKGSHQGAGRKGNE
jgi:hypothetical protein